MVATNQVFTAFAFMSAIGCFIPLPWHLHSWNVGTVCYMLWTGSICLCFAINSIIWNGNAINWAPVWCDITTHLHLGAQIGILCSSLCINRRLFHIAQSKAIATDKAERRKQLIIDLIICIVPGVIEMIVQYTVAGHRFMILEDVGCFPVTLNVGVAVAFIYLPPLLISLCSLFYAIGSIVLFMKRKNEFERWLAGKDDRQTSLTRSRYNRLMGLAGVEAVFGVPLSAYVLYSDIASGIEPYVSWDFVHSNYGEIDQIPRLLWGSDPAGSAQIELSRWLFVTCGLIFFMFFGFASEARQNYWKLAAFFARFVGKEETIKRWQGTTMGTSSGVSSTSKSLPRFATKPRSKRVVGDGLDFDESEFDKSHASRQNRSHAESTNGSLTDIEDEKGIVEQRQPWETIRLPELQTSHSSTTDVPDQKMSNLSPV